MNCAHCDETIVMQGQVYTSLCADCSEQQVEYHRGENNCQ